MVARQQNQRHQIFNAPLLLRREYRGHGVAIFAKVQQHQSGSTTCGGINSEKRQKKPIFIYGTTFRKMEEIFSESKFYCSQKQKKNYGRHTGVRGCGVGVAKEMSVVLARQIASHRSA